MRFECKAHAHIILDPKYTCFSSHVASRGMPGFSDVNIKRSSQPCHGQDHSLPSYAGHVENCWIETLRLLVSLSLAEGLVNLRYLLLALLALRVGEVWSSMVAARAAYTSNDVTIFEPWKPILTSCLEHPSKMWFSLEHPCCRSDHILAWRSKRHSHDINNSSGPHDEDAYLHSWSALKSYTMLHPGSDLQATLDIQALFGQFQIDYLSWHRHGTICSPADPP